MPPTCAQKRARTLGFCEVRRVASEFVKLPSASLEEIALSLKCLSAVPERDAIQLNADAAAVAASRQNQAMKSGFSD
jgi:hypothetical protein